MNGILSGTLKGFYTERCGSVAPAERSVTLHDPVFLALGTTEFNFANSNAGAATRWEDR